MNKYKSELDEKLVAFIVAVALFFLWANFNPALSSYYAGMLIIYFVTLADPQAKWRIQTFSKRTNLKKAFLWSVGLFLGWVLFVNVFLQSFVTETSLSSFFTTLSAEANLSVISDSIFYKLAIWGLIIPLVESFFFMSLIPAFLTTAFKVKLEKIRVKNPDFFKQLFIILLVGVIASLFHVTARLSSDTAMILDVIFFSISAFFVFEKREILIPLLLHILLNTIVLGVASFG